MAKKITFTVSEAMEMVSSAYWEGKQDGVRSANWEPVEAFDPKGFVDYYLKETRHHSLNIHSNNMTTRAKLICQSKKIFQGDLRTYEFFADYQAGGEDTIFGKMTPTAKVEISISNPNVDFVPGKAYYLDFIPVE